MAVGRRGHQRLVRDLAAGADLVLDDDRRLQRVGEGHRELAQSRVDCAARRVLSEHADRPRGPGLRGGEARRERDGGEQAGTCDETAAVHARAPDGAVGDGGGEGW